MNTVSYQEAKQLIPNTHEHLKKALRHIRYQLSSVLDDYEENQEAGITVYGQFGFNQSDLEATLRQLEALEKFADRVNRDCSH